MDSITRRDWLQLLAASSATLAAGCSMTPAESQAQPALVLEAKLIEKRLDGKRMKLRSFSDQIPGPLLKTKPGETLRVRVKNSLPHYDSKGWNGDHNVPHHLDVTNLHLHGLDIAPHLFSPLGTSNPLAPMIGIHSGDYFDYAFQLPKDHPPGMYWYHPHHHGSTVVQAVSGMAGGVIVYGDIDEVPEIKAAHDIPLVIQDLGLFPSEDDPNLWIYDPKQNAIWQTFGGNVTIYNPATGKNDPTNPPLKGGFTTGDYALRYFLLNGQPFYKETHNSNLPTHPLGQQLAVQRFTLAPGEVVRFRLLNACSDNLMPILVEGHELQLIALDGVNFPAPIALPVLPVNGGKEQVLVAPANRAEFLIKAVNRPGIYRIVQLAQSQQFLFSDQKVIAEIEVTGAAKNMPLPAKLPVPSRYYPLIKPSEVKQVRSLVFGGAFPAVMNPYVGLDFTINNGLYQEQAVPQVVQLNDVEEWHISVLGAHHGGTEGHPFHIHVNHFEVVSINGQPPPLGTTIQDTIWVPMKTEVVIRMKFKEFKGKAVYHCHILPHEDTGMMQNFLIV